MRVFFISTFVGTALPPASAATPCAPTASAEYGVSGPAAVASVAMDSALGVVSILILGLASLAIFSAPAPSGVYVVLGLGGLASLGLALVISRMASPALASSVVGRLPGARLRGLAQKLLDAVRAYRHHHGALTMVLVASVGRSDPARPAVLVSGLVAGHRAAADVLLRDRPGDPADHAVPGDRQRTWHEPGGFSLDVRRRGRGPARSVRALDPLHRARDRRQPARRAAVSDE